MFLKICNTMKTGYEYFQPNNNAIDNKLLELLRKCSAALTQTTYGTNKAIVDKYLWLEKSTALEWFKRFAQEVAECCSQSFLRPTSREKTRILLKPEERLNVSAMLGSRLL